MSTDNPILNFAYKNHRGIIEFRTISHPMLHFGTTQWHPEPQWLITGIDHARQDSRTFALDACVFNGRFAIALDAIVTSGIITKDDFANRPNMKAILEDALKYAEVIRDAALRRLTEMGEEMTGQA